LDFSDLFRKVLVSRFEEELEVMSKQQMIFKLARRSSSDLQEAEHLTVRSAPASFSDVGAYGRR